MTERRIQVKLHASGGGTVVIEGRDVSDLVQRIELVSESCDPPRLIIEFRGDSSIDVIPWGGI